MKKFFSLFYAVAVCCGPVSCTDAVPFQSLPEPARLFLSTHYAGKNIPFVKSEFCEYEVVLPDGTEIEFSRKGELKKIEAERVFIPDDIIATLPAPIADYLAITFAGIPVEKIEIGFCGIYKLEMVNDFELKFSKEGKLLSVSNT